MGTLCWLAYCTTHEQGMAGRDMVAAGAYAVADAVRLAAVTAPQGEGYPIVSYKHFGVVKPELSRYLCSLYSLIHAKEGSFFNKPPRQLKK